MAYTSSVRTWWKTYRCIHKTSALGRMVGRMFGKNIGWIPRLAEEAFRAAEVSLVNLGYAVVQSIWADRNCETTGGIGGKPCQQSGTNCSLHNYGIAFDIDPTIGSMNFGNPYFRTRFGNGWDFSDCKLTREQVEGVEGIRTNDGAQVWRWLGWSIGDTMHFQVNCSPANLASGIDWATVPGSRIHPEVSMDKKDWKRTQQALRSLGFDSGKIDGIPGPQTLTAVQAFQKSSGLTEITAFPEYGGEKYLPQVTVSLLMAKWRAKHSHKATVAEKTTVSIT